MDKIIFSKNQLSILCELIFNIVHTADILYIIYRKNREPECYEAKKKKRYHSGSCIIADFI